MPPGARTALATILVCAPLVACSTEPGGVGVDGGLYVLVSVDDQPLPVVLWDTTFATPGMMGETGARAYMFVDTLRFATPTVSRSDLRAFVLVYPARRDSNDLGGVQSAAYTVSGNQIVHTINLGEHQLGADTLFVEADGRLRDNARVSFMCGLSCVQRTLQFRYQRVSVP